MTEHLDATDWRCEACGQSGRIEYVKGASVYEVLHILEDAHRDANAPSTCAQIGKIRVTPAASTQSPKEEA